MGDYIGRDERQLRQLREQLLRMGEIVEAMIADSVRAIVERDSVRAARVIKTDEQVDQLERETDEVCLRALAGGRLSPADLRFAATAMKIVTDLERLGDMGVNIAERAIELNELEPLKPYVDLPRMAEAARWMVHQALGAFVANDAEQARRVIEQDDVVDAYHGQIFRELLTYMMEDPRNITRALPVLSVAKYVERIGDHATNIAEMVVFVVQGQDIRHVARRPAEQ